MPFLNLSPSAILMGWYVLLWGAMAISPADWQNWMLASLIPALLVGALMAGRRALPLTPVSYLMIGAFLSLHTIGAHYTYARMPLGDELAFMLGMAATTTTGSSTLPSVSSWPLPFATPSRAARTSAVFSSTICP